MCGILLLFRFIFKKMNNSFAEQLANVKLKPSKDKTKDFSDPKLAGEFYFDACLSLRVSK